MVKKLSSKKIGKLVFEALVKINTELRPDILAKLRDAYRSCDGIAKEFLGILIENAKIASRERIALCQDTGLVVVFLDIAQDRCIEGDVAKEINQAVKRAYKEAGFRASVVKDPIRWGSSEFTPAVIHYSYARAKRSSITILAKGFGSENKSQLRMLLPTASEDEVVDSVVEVIKQAGGSACPPFIVGVGIGGTSDKAMELAKRALCMPIGRRYKGEYPELAERIKEKANALNIGVLGLGEGPTVLAVNILSYPTHIAGLPVGVNIGCHSTRWIKLWIE